MSSNLEILEELASDPTSGYDQLALAVEHLARAIEGATQVAYPGRTPIPGYPTVPPIVVPTGTGMAPEPPHPAVSTVCPVHRVPFRFVPPGISKKTGHAYEGFYACPERGCDQRPQ